jgi:DNA-binding transcriptional MocR family regulator
VTTAATPLTDLSPDELAARLDAVRADYEALKARGLKLDLTRGKPGADQLDLSAGLLGLPTSHKDRSGTDVRNYGGLEGLLEMREIFADLLGVDVANVVCGGNSSLTMMHQVITAMLLKGGPDSPRPWSQEPVVKFVCPVPGYDRHFTMLAELGIEMLPVPMHQDGPDVEAVRALVAEDPAVKGLWIVPTYANPTGAVCSAEVAAELMAMPAAAPDFRIFWDNAYAVHHLTEHETKSADALGLASASGHPNRPIMFASTSKITFAGAGVAALAASPENKAWYLQRLGFASIGPDKVNHLRHVEFFGSAEGVREHMRKHRDLIAPKFAAVESALRSRLDGMDGTASRVVELAREAGIALTPAGSAFPHGQDPNDRNIRLAPTFPVLEEVELAMAGVAVCVELAALEKLAG